MPQYQGVWSLQQQMQALTSGQWATDPLFDYTTLLLQGDAGANGAQNNVFYDTSPNQFAITRNGNTTQGTFSPFSLQPGEWSNYFPGSASISFSASSGFDINTYDCFECWVNLSVLGTTIVIAGKESNFWLGYNNTNINGVANKFVFAIYNGSSWQAVSSNTTPVVGTWYHVAGIRDSGTLRLYINGVQENTGTFTGTPVNSSFAFSVGAYAGNVDSMTGYVSNVRLVTGATAAVLPYTANFTPSPRPLTAVTGTQILTCQGSRFFDANTQTTAKTLGTITSTPSVQAFSPFAPQYQYTASGTGGSGYFDGTGDYLAVADTTALEPGTGDFCFETWVYHTSASNGSSFDTYTFQTSGGLFVYRNLSNKIQVDSDGVVAILTSASNVPFNSWAHIAVTRSGTTLRIFINGVVDASVTNSTNIAGSGNITYGGRSDGSILDGYMASTRFVKGSAVYTSGFSVPTAPLTAISGTQILLNYTNAGILDGTMKNNLETVGNASVSTSVVKYGSGSMYFDGTGDYLIGKSTDLVSFGTGDFTIEMWVNPASIPASDRVLMDTRAAGTDSGYTPYINGGTLKIYSSSADRITSTSTIAANVWSHIAFVRMSGVMAVYINGVQSGTATYTGSMTCPGRITIGAGFDNAANYNGYIDDLRITKGFARYTQNFIPPSVALPRQ